MTVAASALFRQKRYRSLAAVDHVRAAESALSQQPLDSSRQPIAPAAATST